MVTMMLFGLECHECGRPAQAFTEGVTLPCGCGARTFEARRDAVLRATKHRDAYVGGEARRREAAAHAAIETHRTGGSRDDLAPDAQAWLDIVEVLADLAHHARLAGARR